LFVAIVGIAGVRIIIIPRKGGVDAAEPDR